MTAPVVRPPAAEELVRLQEVEIAAGRAFVDVGMPEIASDEPFPVPTLESYRLDGRAWVVEVDGEVAAYVLVDVLDGHAHVEQVSTHPEHRGAGLGRLLMERVAAWARARGDLEVTLTTFRDVPWNAPYYERLGYRTVADDDRGPELAGRMAEEAAHGLDPATRVAMSLTL